MKRQFASSPGPHGFPTQSWQGNGRRLDTSAPGGAFYPGALLIQVAVALEDANIVAEQSRLLLLSASIKMRVHEEENEDLLVDREEVESLAARATRNNSRRRLSLVVGLGPEDMDTD